MQALGMIETKGMLAAIEVADTMLKAADVRFLEKQKVGGGRVTIMVTGDVAAVKAAVDAGVMAVKKLHNGGLLGCHVIPRPHDETKVLFQCEEEEVTAAPVEVIKKVATKAVTIKEAKSKPEADTLAEKTESKTKVETKNSRRNKTEQESE